MISISVYSGNNMWNSLSPDNKLFIICGNSFIKQNGSLVMNNSFNEQMRKHFKGVDRLLGEFVKNECGHLGTYGFIPFYIKVGNKSYHMGIFQTAVHFTDKPSLAMVVDSTKKLKKYLTKCLRVPDQINMQFPYRDSPRKMKTSVVESAIAKVFHSRPSKILGNVFLTLWR